MIELCKRAALALLVMLVAGCEAKDPTQIVLVIDSDIPVPGELDGFSIKIERNGVERTFLTYDLNPDHSASVRLPATLTLVADKELAQRVTITVTGMQGDKPLVERKARLPFADDRILMLRLALLRTCAYLPKPCAADTTCVDGVCTKFDIDPVTLPEYDKAESDKKQDAALVKDAGMDGSRDRGPAKKDKGKPDALAKDTGKPDAPAKDKAVPDKAIPDAPLPDQNPKCPHPAVTKSCTVGWCTIPKGCFMMGSPSGENCRGTNEDRHQVTLTHGFVISATEVTHGQFLAELKHKPLEVHNGASSTQPASSAVANASWHEAAAYCNALSVKAKLDTCYKVTGPGTKVCGWGSSPNFYWCDATKNEYCVNAKCYSYATKAAYSSGGKSIYNCPGYRLPTEAEWEYAYRAGSSTAYYSGPNTAGKCNLKDTTADPIALYSKTGYADMSHGTTTTQKVGQKLANAWGLSDMAGNALEWVHDGYKANLGTADAVDPVTPAASTHVMRGGSVTTEPYALRAAWRGDYKPTVREYNHFFMGFRCVRTLNPSSVSDGGVADK